MPHTSWVEQRATSLLRDNNLPGWTFGFDNAKTRFGQCDHKLRRITVSRHLSRTNSEDDVEQVILHEIAHALAGPKEGHSRAWLAIARSLGYRGGRTHSAAVPTDTAKWRGRCPAGHEVVRFRKPQRKMSCAKCSQRFSEDHVITWTERSYSATDTSFQNVT